MPFNSTFYIFSKLNYKYPVFGSQMFELVVVCLSSLILVLTH